MEPQPPSLAALSIYQIVRLYCRERLLIDPLEWTSRHVELLQFSFDEPSPAPSTPQLGFTGGKTGSTFVKKLYSHSQFAWRETELRRILASPKCPFIALDTLPFYFNRYHTRTLFYTCLFLGGDITSATQGIVPPVVACIDRDRIHDLRLNRIYSRRGRRSSKPTSRLLKLQLKKVTPPEPLHDPYIVALLIGLAYRQRDAMRLNGHDAQADTSTFICQVVLTDINDESHVHLFAAAIPSSFLTRLDFPAIPPSAPATPPISIRHTMIPCKPYKTFRSRIFSHLISTYDSNIRIQ